MKKFIIAAVAATTLGLGLAGSAAPAQAQIFFGFGAGGGGCGYYGCGYHRRYWGGPGYGYAGGCRLVNVRRHHHWVTVRRCW